MVNPFVDVFGILVLALLFLFLPLGLMAILFGLSRKYRGMFDAIGFSRKEMGLLIVGSLSLLLVPSEVPLFFYKNWFLAVNLGGAIIPTVLSIHLLRAKKIGWSVWLPGIFAVSLVTFLTTRVQPSAGIVSEFPFLFIPSLTGASLALALYSRHSPQAPAFAYAATTLGSLIGADVYHLPELFQAAEFAGSIGGAGVFDLVYIGGLVSFAVVLLFAGSRLRQLKATLPHAELARERVARELQYAALALMYGQAQLSAQRSLGAVQERIRQVGRALQTGGSLPEILARVVPHPAAPSIYQAVARYANNALLDFYSGRWCLVQSQALLEWLQKAERVRYAPLGQRIGAFLADALLMGAVLAGVGALLFYGRSDGPSIQLVLFGLATIQVVYFTAFEYYWKGRTPGKALFGIRVTELGDNPPSFLSAFTRNTLRLLDFFLLGYLVSIFLIASGTRMQRIGDRIAETVVLRRKPGAISGPQPIYMPQPSTQ